MEYVGGLSRVAIERQGEGPLVLFLHGVGGNRSNWSAQLGPVAAAGFTAAAWDAPGYGESDPLDGTPDFPRFADRAAALIGELGHAAAHIVGLSMGGRTALDLYARYPTRVSSLTLADTSAGSAAVNDPARAAAMLEARRRLLIDEGKSPADIAESLIAPIAGPQISTEARTALIASHAALSVPGYLWALEAVTRFTDFPPWESIAVPTQIIVGEHDRLATPDFAAEVTSRISGAALTVIAGAGHVSNIEAPDAFNAALIGFLRGLA